MRSQYVIAGHVLDVEELIFGRDFANRNDLDPVFLAIGRVHKQVAEIARPFTVLKRLAHRVKCRPDFAMHRTRRE